VVVTELRCGLSGGTTYPLLAKKQFSRKAAMLKSCSRRTIGENIRYNYLVNEMDRYNMLILQ